jgi:hypothetical protein
MRLDALSGIAALLLSIPALMQVAAGRLDVAGAAGRITIVLLACAAGGAVIQSIVAAYRDASDRSAGVDDGSPVQSSTP